MEYTRKQKSFEIAGVRIGGPTGLSPTTMVGSIFYGKDKLVIDSKKGRIDLSETEDAIRSLTEVSEKTGLPTVLDVVAETSEAIRKYLHILADMTDFPLMIDGSGSFEVNAAGLDAAREMGIMDRVILNSMTPDDDPQIFQKIQDVGLRNVVVLAFSPKSMTSSEKRVALAGSIIDTASKIGVENVMVDTGVLDLLSLGIASRAIVLIKEKYGVPTGCGAHNAVNMWQGLVPKFGKEAKKPALVGSLLMPITLGADFVLFGPIKDAPFVYPSVAMINTAQSGVLLEKKIRPDRTHPRFKIG